MFESLNFTLFWSYGDKTDPGSALSFQLWHIIILAHLARYLTEDYQGLQEVNSEAVHHALTAAADGRVEAGDDHVQQGRGHPLQLLYQTLVVTIELGIVGLALTVIRRSRCEVWSVNYEVWGVRWGYKMWGEVMRC